MKDQGFIDHMVASIYLDDEESFIKFGSYDPLGLKANAKLETFNTVNVRDWGLYMTKPTVGGVAGTGDQTKSIHINPALPYLYVQTTDTQKIAQQIINAGQKVRVGLMCNSIVCHTSKSCKDLTDKEKQGFEVKLPVDGLHRKNYVITIPGKNLWVEAEELDMETAT